MKRLQGAWLGLYLLAACSGTDHSLGQGRAPVEPMGDPVAAGGAMSEGGAGAPGSGGASRGIAGGLTDAIEPASGGSTVIVPPTPTNGAGGALPMGTGGTARTGGARSTGAGGSIDGAPGTDPVIPPVMGDCPVWANSTITFMGLAGVQLAVGAKPPSPSAPMLIYWHGTGSTSGEFALMAAPVANGVTAAGGVIVSFDGTTGGDLNSGTFIFGAGDLKLIDNLVACAVRDHNIDPRRIYTMGCSAGGLMSAATAALRSSYIAAAAPNSGGFPVSTPAFEDGHTPPLMTVHGKMGTDAVVIDFAQASALADMTFKARGGFVIDCDTGGGHCGGAGLAGDAWKFFQAHPFGVSPEPWAGGLPAGFSPQCAIK